MGKKIIVMIFIALFILNLVPDMQLLQAQSNTQVLRVGDYVQLGTYYDEPILWRVINVDQQGDPLLYAENILCTKKFDSEGYNSSDSMTKHYGSNYWPDANIRQWLNSSEQNIKWKNPLTNKGKEYYSSPYNGEKGFLADGNFTELERGIIKPITNKVVLSELEKSKRDGGSEEYIFDYNSKDLVSNYDKAYYKNVTDKVFLLSVKQLNDYVLKRGWSYEAKPTAKAVDKSSSVMDILDKDTPWSYFLNTPNKENTFSVMGIFQVVDKEYSASGYSTNITGYSLVPNWLNVSEGSNGIRPALSLNMKLANFETGIGTADSPYVVSRGAGLGKTPSNWAAAEIEAAKGYGLSTEKVQRNYQQPITREEFCELAIKLYESLERQRAYLPIKNKFIDTANPEIVKANNLGIVGGVSANQFAPNNKVTRQEISVMLYNTIKAVDPSLVKGDYQAGFEDEKDIAVWAKNAVMFMNKKQIVGGVGGNKVAPMGNATREQAIAMVKRAFDTFKTEVPNIAEPIKAASLAENGYVKRVDPSTITIVDELGETIYNNNQFSQNAGVSLAKQPVEYNSEFSFVEHKRNLTKLFDMCGMTLDVRSGYWDPSKRNSWNFNSNNNIGRIMLANESNFNGENDGRVVIQSDFWRRGENDYWIRNEEFNIFLETYKYFIGFHAGEDLWALIDDAFKNRAASPAKFNFTEVNKGSGYTDYFGDARYTVYELTHSSGAKVLWYDAPTDKSDFQIVVLKRGY